VHSSRHMMMVDVTEQTLAGIELFRHLPVAERKGIAERCHPRHYAAKKQIIAHADTSTDIYFIVSGKVRATIFSGSGKEVYFRDLGAGEMFGEFSAIDAKPRSANIVALSDSFVVSMPAEAFGEVLRTHPGVYLKVLHGLASLVRLLSERVVEMSTLGVKNRIHAELLRLAQGHLKADNTAVVSPAPTHADIANRISTQREAVTRELNHLVDVGVIERLERRGELIIKDVAQLSRMVDEVRVGKPTLALPSLPKESDKTHK
jgi:CRP/FNR family transcriptional regulator, cyclic AMP receptor protein